MLTPIYTWVVCNEPEDHLDQVAKTITALISSEARILGLSDKDRTLLQRILLQRIRAIHKTACDDIPLFSHPLLQQQVNPGVAAVQAAISDLMQN